MKNKINLCAKAAFVCAISPNLVAAAIVLFRRTEGCFFDWWQLKFIIYLFVGFQFHPNLTMVLGTITVVLAVIAIRKRETNDTQLPITAGTLLAIIALVIGILEIMVPVLWHAGRAYGLWA